MEEVARQVVAGFPAELEIRDVDDDADLHRLYDESVPVLLVNGRKAFKYRVTADALRKRLADELEPERPRRRLRFLR